MLDENEEINENTEEKEPEEKLPMPTFWLDKQRFIIVVIGLMLIFFTLMGFLYLKADEITKDPCSICAEYHGEDVICRVGDVLVSTRTYFPNGTIEDDIPNRGDSFIIPDLSGLNESVTGG